MAKKKNIGEEARQRVSEHAQGFFFGALVGVGFGVVGTILTLWASLEPLVR